MHELINAYVCGQIVYAHLSSLSRNWRIAEFICRTDVQLRMIGRGRRGGAGGGRGVWAVEEGRRRQGKQRGQPQAVATMKATKIITKVL